MKATGVEIKQFWDEWPPGEHWYHDDSVLEVYTSDEDEKFLLEPTQKYDLSDFGILIWQGPTDMEIPKTAPICGCRDVNVESWFRFWKKAKTSTSFGVTVKNEDVETFKELAAQHGWKIS